jgi:transposase
MNLKNFVIVWIMHSSNVLTFIRSAISTFLPVAKSGGRPSTTDMRSVINAIFYMLAESCQWRALPHDFPAWQTVYTYFHNWKRDGTWLKIHDVLHDRCRVAAGREISPSEVMLDSQTRKSVTRLHRSIGYDAGKKIKGRNRHLTVDSLGLVMRVSVSASVTEREGEKQGLQRMKEMTTERTAIIPGLG